MKEKTKKLMAFAVVAAAAIAAVCYILKKRKDAETPGAASGTTAATTASVDVNDTGSIIDHLTGVGSGTKQVLRNHCTAFEKSLTSRASIEAKAVAAGVTYAQMAVMNAAYVTYLRPNASGEWVEKSEGGRAMWLEISAQVKAM